MEVRDALDTLMYSLCKASCHTLYGGVLRGQTLIALNAFIKVKQVRDVPEIDEMRPVIRDLLEQPYEIPYTIDRAQDIKRLIIICATLIARYDCTQSFAAP